jgi:ankyrin repeat protein
MEDILRAAREGDEEEVNRLLDADPTLLERMDSEGSREGYEKWKLKPLAVAARCGHLGMVRLLVQRGANVNGMDYKGTTALSYAVYGDHAEVVAYLLHHGAKADGNQASSVPLIAASMRRHVCVVRVLLKHLEGQGLDDRRGGSGWTALHWAAFGGHDDVVRLLLLAGADPTMRDNYNNTPRALAENKRRAACAALLQVRP